MATRYVVYIPAAIFTLGIAVLIFARLLIRNADAKARALEVAVEDPSGGDET